MYSNKSHLVLIVGAVITIGGLIQAFSSVGPNTNLRLVYAWSVIAVIGLYLWGWGTMQYLLLTDAKSNSTRSSSSAPRMNLSGPPSAQSRTIRRQPDQQDEA